MGKLIGRTSEDDVDLDVCPVCGSTDIEGDRPETDSTSAWQNCSCNACGAKWRDEFAFERTVVHTGMKKKAR